MKLGFWTGIIVLLGLPHALRAFPEMVRHGYLSCTTCHYSPNGGKILTPYGRSLSREVLSTWGAEGEENILHGLGSFTLPESLQLGGDFRGLQVYRDTATARDARFFLMQAEMAVAASLSDWVLVASIGYRPSSEQKKGKLILPEHYLLYNVSPSVSVRLGKFARPYGLPLPDHYLSIKRRLGLERENELYHVQASYLGETFEVPLTATFGSLSFDEPDERGFTIRPAIHGERTKAGFTYSLMKSDDKLSHTVGPWVMWAPTKKWLIAAEWDFQWSEERAALKRFSVGLLRFNYEIFKGFNAQVWDEVDYHANGNTVHRPAIGFQFYPRPHWEIQGSYAKELDSRQFEQGLLLVHYYL